MSEHVEIDAPQGATLVGGETVLTYSGNDLWWSPGGRRTPPQPPGRWHFDLAFVAEQPSVVAAYRDGIIVHARPAVGPQADRAYWIPIRENGRLDVLSRVAISGEPGMPQAPPAAFVRYRDEIAWLVGERDPGDPREPDRGKMTLCVFNVGSGKVRQAPLQGVLVHWRANIGAFDGRYVLVARHVVDVATGQAVGTYEHPTFSGGYFAGIGMRAGVFYWAKVSKEGYELLAVPLMEPDKARVIHRWDAKDAPRNRTSGLPDVPVRDLFFFDEDMLWAWNGQTWVMVPT